MAAAVWYLLVRPQFRFDRYRNFVVLSQLGVKELLQKLALTSLLLGQLWS
jgi:hypothetical protein